MLDTPRVIKLQVLDFNFQGTALIIAYCEYVARCGNINDGEGSVPFGFELGAG
jgi:hypothetical protein